jgi:hypothetical protein
VARFATKNFSERRLAEVLHSPGPNGKGSPAS